MLLSTIFLIHILPLDINDYYCRGLIANLIYISALEVNRYCGVVNKWLLIFSPKGEGGKFIVSKNSNKVFFLDSCI